MEERRRDKRYKVMSRIAVLHLPEQPNPLGPTIESNWHTTVDVSINGLRFKSQRPVCDESFLRIDVVRARPHPPIILPAIVKWTHRLDGDYYFDVGVELLDVDDEHRHAWITYIENTLQTTAP